MSWSVSCVGKPQNIINHLKEYGNSLTGMSKEEFDAALPHLVGMIEQNKYMVDGVDQTPLLNIVASGSGYVAGTTESRNCVVKIETNYFKLV